MIDPPVSYISGWTNSLREDQVYRMEIALGIFALGWLLRYFGH